MSNIQRRINPMTGPSNVARPPMSAMNTAGLTPKEAAGILRRHILMIMLFTFAGLFIGGTSWYLMKKYRPRYTAQAAIEVLPPGKENPLELRSIMPDREIYYQLRTTKAAAMKFQGMLEKLVQQDVIRSTKWYSQFDDSVRDAVYDLKKNLTVSPQRDSTLILVSMTCGNAGESADIVNEMIRLFLMDQKVSSQTDTGDELSKRKSELNKLQTLLGTHNTTLNNMRQASAFGNLNKTLFQDYLEDKLANIERLSDELATSKSELDGRIANLQRRVDSSYDINNSSYDDEIIRERVERDVIASNMRQRISILEVNLASQLAKFGEDHRQVRETRDTIEQAKADLSARQKEIGDIERNADLIRAKEELITLNARIETTENRLTLAKQDHKTLSNLRAEYENTVIKRDETQKDLEKLSNIIQALAARYENSDTSKLRLFQNARKPLEISSPRLKLNLFGGFMLGLLAGVGLAFAIELLNDVLRSPSDVSKHLRVPLLGMISHSEEDEAIGGINLYHVVRQAPYSIMSECYRMLRTNLRLSESGACHKSLLVTSCNSGCGKTTVATNLSSTLVAEGMRVLLIDTNFRRPSLTGLYPRNEESGSGGADSGLSNYLMGQCSFEDICRESGVDNLDIIDAGPLPANPSELLSNAKMTDLVKQADAMYDFVVVDGPPLIVSEAKILASLVDSTIVVFNATSTRRGEAQRSLRELSDINANIAGTVLLGVRSMKGGYFQEVYKSYLQYQQVQLTASAR